MTSITPKRVETTASSVTHGENVKKGSLLLKSPLETPLHGIFVPEIFVFLRPARLLFKVGDPHVGGRVPGLTEDRKFFLEPFFG